MYLKSDAVLVCVNYFLLQTVISNIYKLHATQSDSSHEW